MSDQGEIPDGRAGDFGLIETLLWTRDAGFFLLAQHLARLAASARVLGFAYDEARAKEALEKVVDEAARADDAARLRVRLVLNRNGALEASATPIEPVSPDAVWRVAIARRRFSSADPLLRHKTTRRALYEDELASARQQCSADEVLFLNERGELCEGARCNLFVARDAALLTPPLACGLLPGTLRARLIAEGRAREAVLRPDDIADDTEFFMGNSVRGLVRARFAP